MDNSSQIKQFQVVRFLGLIFIFVTLLTLVIALNTPADASTNRTTTKTLTAIYELTTTRTILLTPSPSSTRTATVTRTSTQTSTATATATTTATPTIAPTATQPPAPIARIANQGSNPGTGFPCIPPAGTIAAGAVLGLLGAAGSGWLPWFIPPWRFGRKAKKCGAPQNNPGFQISMKRDEISIGAGAYSVKGILCENQNTIRYTQQSNASDSPSLLQQIRATPTMLALVYLQAWKANKNNSSQAHEEDSDEDTLTNWRVGMMPVSPNRVEKNIGQQNFSEWGVLKSQANYCRLAIIQWDAESHAWQVHDSRAIIPPIHKRVARGAASWGANKAAEQVVKTGAGAVIGQVIVSPWSGLLRWVFAALFAGGMLVTGSGIVSAVIGSACK